MSIGGLAGTLLAGLSKAPQAYQEAQQQEQQRQLNAQRLRQEQQQQQALALLGGNLGKLFGNPGGLPGQLSPVNTPPPTPMPGQASVPGNGSPQAAPQPAPTPQPAVSSVPGRFGGMSVPSAGGGGIATLNSLLQQASASLPDGYRAVVTSGERPGATVAGTGGTSQHAHGNAIDVQIIGPNGPIPNKGEDTTGLYQKLAVAMHGAAPAELQPKLAWGGNFTTGPANGPRDLMHFDLGGDRGRFGRLSTLSAGASPELHQEARQTAQATVSQIDPSVFGRASIAGLAGAIEKSNPGADPVVKFLALEQASKLLAPSQQAQLQFLMEQNRERFQMEMQQRSEAFSQSQQQRSQAHTDSRDDRRFQQQTDLEDRREKDRAQREGPKGYTLMQPPGGGPAMWVKPGAPSIAADVAAGSAKVGTASRGAIPPEARTLMAQGIANYQLPPLSSWALKSPEGTATMAEVLKLNPDYQATEYSGKQSGARAVGTRSATLGMATNVAEQMIPLVEETSNRIDRTEFPTINTLQMAIQKGTGSEDVVRFMEQINTLKYVYARALNPTGTARVEDLKRFDDILSQGWSQNQISAALDQMRQSLAAERRGIDKTQGKPETPAPPRQESGRTGGAAGAYKPGDIIEKGGKRYRVTGGDPSDPDVEEVP